MRVWLAFLLIGAIGCQKLPAGGATGGSGAESPTSKPEPFRESFESGLEATEWLMNTKHTLRGVDPARAHILMQELLELGVAEMKVADVRKDPADPSFENAGRLLAKLPADVGARRKILEHAARWNGASIPSNQDSDYVEYRFGP